MIRIAVNVFLLCIPAIIAGFISARLARTSTEEWVLLAWVPPLPLLGFGLYLGVILARDPTAANLWPFVMVPLIALSALLFGVFLLARRVVASGASKGPPWRRDRTG